MTTYRLAGQTVTVVEDGNGDAAGASFAPVELQIIARDSADYFRYRLSAFDDNESAVPDVTMDFAPSTYAVTVGGAVLDNSWQWEIGEVTYVNGTAPSIVMMVINEAETIQHSFTLAGTPLPQFATFSQLANFVNSTDDIGPIFSGDWGDRSTNFWDDVQGIQSTENDRMKGTAAADRFDGGAGRDVLIGGRGADVLNGGTGRDKIEGGRGADVLSGWTQADVFVFKGARIGKDVITDFKDDVDTLRLDDALWSGDLGKRAVIQAFASRDGDDVVLDFGKHEIRIEGLGKRGALIDDIEII